MYVIAFFSFLKNYRINSKYHIAIQRRCFALRWFRSRIWKMFAISHDVWRWCRYYYVNDRGNCWGLFWWIRNSRLYETNFRRSWQCHAPSWSIAQIGDAMISQYLRFGYVSPYFISSRCWVAAHMCVLSHFRTCDVCAEVRAERFLELCVRCVCVQLVFGVRCAIALLHTFWTEWQDFLYLNILFFLI